MKLNMPTLLMVVLFSTVTALAQKHEIGLLSGGTTTGDRDIRSPQPGTLQISTGLTYYATTRIGWLISKPFRFILRFRLPPPQALISNLQM